MSDALAKVKRDLGKDAVILHTRTCQRGGLLGIGTRSVFEITATADKKVMAFRKTQRRGERGSVPTQAQASEPIAPKPAALEPVTPNPVAPNLVAPASPRRDPKPEDDAMRSLNREPKPSARVADDPVLRREVVEIRSMVQDLLRRSDRADHPRAPAELIDTYTHLIGQDVQDELAVALLDRVSENLERAGNDYWDAQGRLVQRADASPDAVQTELLNVIREMLPPAAPLELKTSGGPTVVALVGPTGVGKTTTIAKLAANMKLRENKSVGLITIDSYRIAAVEQLKTYAQILKAPIVSVLTPGEMRSAVDRMAGLDLVLIDTAGRSQRDDSRVAELDAFIREARPDQVHLVLSTTSREATIREAIDKFFPLGARRLIFTKLDEAVGFGVILNVLKTVDMRLSYLTNGQAVPDDIEIASAGRVARLIVGDLQRTPDVLSPPDVVGLRTKGGRK
ncbi:MAG: flagellar biosynthesis protein FlhF [Phycisphaerae bacterium]